MIIKFKRLLAYWKKFAAVLAIIQTYIILTVVYGVAVGLASLGAWILGRDLLDKRRRQTASVWYPKAPMDNELDLYRHQF